MNVGLYSCVLSFFLRRIKVTKLVSFINHMEYYKKPSPNVTALLINNNSSKSHY